MLSMELFGVDSKGGFNPKVQFFSESFSKKHLRRCREPKPFLGSLLSCPFDLFTVLSEISFHSMLNLQHTNP